MSKLIFIILTLVTSFSLLGQEYIMFHTSYIKVKDGKHSQLRSAILKHNAKYHNGDNRPKAYLWYVDTGPKSGQYTWAEGPMTFSDKDKPLTKEYMRDWQANISPFGEQHSFIYMMRDEEMTYNPENEKVGKNILLKRIKIKNGPEHVDAVENTVQKIADVLENTGSSQARRVYRNVFPDGGQEIMLVYPFNSWTQFGNGTLGLPDGFQDDYEEINGRGSWKRDVMDILSEHSHGVSNEVQTMVEK